MSVLGIIALIFGVLGVWLTIKQHILCWPSALIGVSASLMEFYHERLFGDMALQVFYFGAGVYGWIYWNKKQQETFRVKSMPLTLLPLMVLVTAAQSYLYYLIILKFNGDQPLFDGILTACSLTATFMMTKKWVENWLAWILIDALYVVLYGIKEMWLFGLLYLFFTIMAVYGWQQWKKEVSLKLAS
jgi:nicotinamide mononucleotide transporter